jgi:hypothetical protein
MKYKFSIFIFLIVLSNCFSQEKFDWNNIQKVELYSFKKNKKIEEYSSSDLNKNSIVKCDTKKIIKYLKELKMFKNDVVIENKFYALRVYFAKSRTDFILFLNQGVMFKLKNGNKYFEIESGFKKLIEDSTN